MPGYSYRCDVCGKTKIEIHRIGDAPQALVGMHYAPEGTIPCREPMVRDHRADNVGDSIGPASVPSLTDPYYPGRRVSHGPKTTKQRGYTSNGWRALSKRVIAEEGRCRRCGSTEDLTADHIVPLSEGGTNARSNLECLCRRHNSSKARGG